MKRLPTNILFVLLSWFSMSANAVVLKNTINNYKVTFSDSLSSSNLKVGSNKITLSPSMLINKNSDTFPAIIDEQVIAGDPANGEGGSPITSWTSSWNPNSPYPHYAIIDFGQEIDLFTIYIYDVDGVGNFSVESGVDRNWNSLFTDSLTGYNTWNEHPDLSVKTRFLRLIKKEGGARVGEIIVYGVSGNLSSDASLSNLLIEDSTVNGFNPAKLNYTVNLPEGTTKVPVISATANDSIASISVVQTSKLPGVSTIEVTAENGVTIQFYTIFFTVQNSGEKEYIHLNSEGPEWLGTAIKDFYEADDFDIFWAVKGSKISISTACKCIVERWRY